MAMKYFQKSNQRIKDKVLAFDYSLFFLILLLGIISLFAMYSSERGNFSYHTQSHFYRFSIFFLLFVILSFFRINFWFRSAYLFYIVVLLYKTPNLFLLFFIYNINLGSSKLFVFALLRFLRFLNFR